MIKAPGPIGLYDPRHEHDSCGVSFVAHLKGKRSNDLVVTGLTALTNLEHRGATGAEPDTGDGAGILIQVPDRLYRAVVDFELPVAGAYGTGIAFLPGDPTSCDQAQQAINDSMVDVGLEVIGWRDVPVSPECLGATARAAMPTFKQLFVRDPAGTTDIDLDRKAFVARKRSRRELVGQLGAATHLDHALDQDMDVIGFELLEQAFVVRDGEDAEPLLVGCVLDAS